MDKNRPYAQVLEVQHEQGALSATVTYVYGYSLISQAIDGVTSYYHHDGSHSVRALSDESGTLSDTYAYDAYGNLLRQSGDTQNPYRYRSEAFEPELDAYYLRARYYQPGSGRFSSIDPVEGDINVPRSLHRYLYAYNDPVNNFDPSGAITLTETLTTVGIVGMLAGTEIGFRLGEKYQNLYVSWADKYFPDAGIIGLSGYGKINFDPLTRFLGISLPIVTNAGYVRGYEAMFSFGSSQLAFFEYKGVQSEVTWVKEKTLGGIDISLYTGYVFNMWNAQDYTGQFRAFYFSVGSYFHDPNRVRGNTGPWGISWPVLSGALTCRPPFIRKSTSIPLVGHNFTGYRLLFGDPKVVPYGQLARLWTISQAGMLALSAWDHNLSSSVATFLGGCTSGVIAKAKQIYNRNVYFPGSVSGTVKDAHYWRSGNYPRPDNWRTGPTNPVSRLLGGIWPW